MLLSLATLIQDGRTSLSLAAESGHTRIVERLVTAGADPCAKDSIVEVQFEGLMLYLTHCTYHMSPHLLMLVPYDIPQCTWAPLHYAADNGHAQIVSVLLAHPGVDVNATDNVRMHDENFPMSC